MARIHTKLLQVGRNLEKTGSKWRWICIWKIWYYSFHWSSLHWPKYIYEVSYGKPLISSLHKVSTCIWIFLFQFSHVNPHRTSEHLHIFPCSILSSCISHGKSIFSSIFKQYFTSEASRPVSRAADGPLTTTWATAFSLSAASLLLLLLERKWEGGIKRKGPSCRFVPHIAV